MNPEIPVPLSLGHSSSYLRRDPSQEPAPEEAICDTIHDFGLGLFRDQY